MTECQQKRAGTPHTNTVGYYGASVALKKRVIKRVWSSHLGWAKKP